MIPATQKVFMISDLHFYHTNIIKYCNRPYTDVIEMNADIIKRWNSTVHKNDIVWNLGDFAFIKKHECEKIKNLVSKLHGRQFLILGNHDRRISRDLRFWYKIGFERVYDKPILFQDQYILSHEPVKSKHHLDLIGTQLKNIHGHIHNSNQDFDGTENKPLTSIPDVSENSFNVSLEVINYAPIRFEQIVDAMNRCHFSIDKNQQKVTTLPEHLHIPFIHREDIPEVKPDIVYNPRTGFEIPEACKHCSNRNPDGSLRGPCMCTIGTPKVMC